MRNLFPILLLLGSSLTPVVAQTPTDPAPQDQPDGDGGTSAFYRWSQPLPAPGHLIRTEPLEPRLALEQASMSERILYSSTSGVGRGAIGVSGTLYLPKGTPPRGGWPLIAWAHGTTGFADVCAPSWHGWSARDVAFLNGWLARGFAVVATDYEGLGTPGVHPYLLWRSEGQAVLDAARAAVSSQGHELSGKVIIDGQSQGSGAALGATTLQPRYAPDVKLAGTIATGLVMTFAGTGGAGFVEKPSEYTDPTRMDAAFAMLRIAGTDRALHPDQNAADYVTPQGRTILHAARTSCLRDMFALEAKDGTKGSNAFSRDLAPIDADMERNFMLPDDKMPVPIFAGTGLADGMAGTMGQYDAVRAMCRAGTTVVWHTYPGLTHGGAVIGSFPDALAFARTVLADKPVATNCAAIQVPGAVQSATPGLPFNS